MKCEQCGRIADPVHSSGWSMVSEERAATVLFECESCRYRMGL